MEMTAGQGLALEAAMLFRLLMMKRGQGMKWKEGRWTSVDQIDWQRRTLMMMMTLKGWFEIHGAKMLKEEKKRASSMPKPASATHLDDDNYACAPSQESMSSLPKKKATKKKGTETRNEGFSLPLAATTMTATTAETTTTAEAATTTATTVIEACRKLCVEEGNNKVLLLSMSFGLMNGEHMMGDTTQEPFQPSEKSKKPKKPDSQKEVDRRGHAKRRKDPTHCVPKPKGWDVPKMLEWLKQNPIQDKEDTEFLQKEEQIFHNDCCRAMEHKRKNQDEKLASANWTGSIPWLHLCHAAMEKDSKEAFLVGAWTLAREERGCMDTCQRRAWWAWKW
jgi:hypothetical protein